MNLGGQLRDLGKYLLEMRRAPISQGSHVDLVLTSVKSKQLESAWEMSVYLAKAP